jgi:hypothetical protein
MSQVQLAKTKTFFHHARFARKQDGEATEWTQLPTVIGPRDDIDTQISNWVDEHRLRIVDPGKISIDKQWESNNVLVVSYGLTILYLDGPLSDAAIPTPA